LKSFWGNVMLKCLKIFTVVMLIFSMIILSGCIERFRGEGTDIGSLKPITPEDIESIFAAISSEMTEKYPVETDEDGAILVYWLDGGTVWHMSANCGNIQKADVSKVCSGTVADAENSGKTRACKICYNEDYLNSETQAFDSLHEDPSESADRPVIDDSTVVYWLSGGSVWHLNNSCSSLSRSDPEVILSGSVYQAYTEGKSRACKVCSGDVEVDFTQAAESSCVSETSDELTSDDTTEKFKKEYDEDGQLIVFWTKNGKVWHESRYCSSLSRTDPDNLIFGTETDAASAGKERACKTCSQ